MAVLPDGDRKTINAELMRYFSEKYISTGSLTKAQLRAAVNGLDAELSSQAVTFNNAIPEPAKTILQNKDKATLLEYVVSKRGEVL